MSKVNTFIIAFLIAICIRYYFDNKNVEPKKEILLVKHAFVPLRFNVSNLFADDPRILRYNWVRQWVAINATTIEKESGWTLSGSFRTELIAMGIEDRFVRCMHQLAEHEPLVLESRYPLLVLAETMNFFPVGVFLNSHTYDVNQELSVEQALAEIGNVQQLIICNL